MEKQIVQLDNSQTSADHMRLEHWSIERLIPSSRNARTHSDVQVAEIAGSIKSFGFANPILVSEDAEVIAGHGRLAAARKLGLSEVPVIVLHGLSEVRRRQLMLADNRIAANAGWDLEMLRLELTDLAALGAELEGLGFTAQELARALNGGQIQGLTDEDGFLSSLRSSYRRSAISGASVHIGSHVVTAPTLMPSPPSWVTFNLI
jgi:hypothetical protein